MQIFQGIVYSIVPYSTIDEARSSYAPDITLREVPDYIPEGTGYDLKTDLLYATDATYACRRLQIQAQRRIADADLLSALKAIRRGDTSEDWEARATALEAYLDALDAVPSQAGYPIEVEWPEYPIKP